jgi:protein involved in polysaccharide export with SLBB domain
VSRPASAGILPIATAHSDPDGQHTSVQLELKDVYSPASSAANLEIRSGDVITVLETAQRLIYIIGDVNHPGSVELVTQERVSLMQVLAAAGGLNGTAAAGDTRIMHKDSQGLYAKSTTVDLKKIMKGKSEDRLLVAGDIVVVPSSKLKQYRDSTAAAGINAALFVVLTHF